MRHGMQDRATEGPRGTGAGGGPDGAFGPAFHPTDEPSDEGHKGRWAFPPADHPSAGSSSSGLLIHGTKHGGAGGGARAASLPRPDRRHPHAYSEATSTVVDGTTLPRVGTTVDWIATDSHAYVPGVMTRAA